jgi:hypothetical protein
MSLQLSDGVAYVITEEESARDREPYIADHV